MQQLNRYLLLLILFSGLLMAASCNKRTDPVQLVPAGNPLTDLPWLKEIKQNLEISAKVTGAQIIQYTYRNEPVFWIDDCYNCFDKMIIVYDEAGNEICKFGGIAGLNTCPDFMQTATDSTMLWNYVQQ
ncbi:MAG: hypothetical protein KQI35_00460 [Bacteroidetes bacterium]|nr:hypothetical protein [Bacteroidota bacterium]